MSYQINSPFELQVTQQKKKNTFKSLPDKSDGSTICKSGFWSTVKISFPTFGVLVSSFFAVSVGRGCVKNSLVIV